MSDSGSPSEEEMRRRLEHADKVLQKQSEGKLSASVENFNKATGGELFEATVYVSRVDATTVVFDVASIYDWRAGTSDGMGMDIPILESLRKASVEKRVQLKISCVTSRDAVNMFHSYMVQPTNNITLVLNKKETRELHTFLKWLAPVKCETLHSHVIQSIYDIELLIKDFGFTALSAMWQLPGEYLSRPIFEKLNYVSLYVPLCWFSTQGAKDFIINTKIPKVELEYVKYLEEGQDDHDKAFPFEVVQKIIESWLAGASFHRRIIDATFCLKELREYLEKNFKIVWEGEEAPSSGAYCNFYEDCDGDDFGLYTIYSADGSWLSIQCDKIEKTISVTMQTKNDSDNRFPEATSKSVGEPTETTREDLKEVGASLQKSPEVNCQENDDTSTTTHSPASDISKRVEASVENFEKATGEEVFYAIIYMRRDGSRRDGSLSFDVTDLCDWNESALDLLTLKSLRKASKEKRIRLKIRNITSTGAQMRINSWDMKPKNAKKVVLTKKEVKKLHAFLKGLEPSECIELCSQLFPSVEDIETLVKDFGFTTIEGIWDYPAEYLQRPVYEKVDWVRLTVPLKWFSTRGARDFILNTKISSVILKYYQGGYHSNVAFPFEIVEKLIESWLAGAPFRLRCFEGDFGRELKKFIEKRFTVIKKKGAELPPVCAVPERFSACEEEDDEYDTLWAAYRIRREDGAIMTVGCSQDKDYTPFGITLTCVKRGTKD